MPNSSRTHRVLLVEDEPSASERNASIQGQYVGALPSSQARPHTTAKPRARALAEASSKRRDMALVRYITAHSPGSCCLLATSVAMVSTTKEASA